VGVAAAERVDETGAGYRRAMSDSQDMNAEQLDDDKFDNPAGGPAHPDYPPDEPLAVEDPSIAEDGAIVEDDLATRVEREEPEPDAVGGI
jgi:hypothetical protein